MLTLRQFQLETDETESFREELRIWKSFGGFDNRPPPLILETYLDTSALTSNQSLVIVDDRGQRWDVFEALKHDEPDISIAKLDSHPNSLDTFFDVCR